MTKPNYPPPDTKTPKPLYSCANADCAERVSHCADDLYWVGALNGWYCEACIDVLDEIPEEDWDCIGVTLAEFLEGRCKST